MKFVFLFLSFFSQVIYAQHLSFNGIPIDGLINNFQSKLFAKGYKKNIVESGKAPNGQRVFDGKFKGRNAQVSVFYNRKTKLVYKVTAAVEYDNETIRDAQLKKQMQQMGRDYIYDYYQSDDSYGDELFSYFIYANNTKKTILGDIVIKKSWILKYPSDATDIMDSRRTTTYTIIHEYTDKRNFDLLTPSTTEPIRMKEHVCGRDRELNEYFLSAAKFRNEGLWGSYKKYLELILDWYKYDCVPEPLKDYENRIEEAIIACEKYYIGTFQNFDFYKSDEVCKDSDFISLCNSETTTPEDDYSVKIIKTDIGQQLQILRKVRELYHNKKKQLMNSWPSDFWTEELLYSFDIIEGQNTYRQPEKKVRWKKEAIKVKFHNNYRNPGERVLYVTLFSDNGKGEYNSIKNYLSFDSEKELDKYISILSKANF